MGQRKASPDINKLQYEADIVIPPFGCCP